jgi:hypothetical protein
MAGESHQEGDITVLIAHLTNHVAVEGMRGEVRDPGLARTRSSSPPGTRPRCSPFSMGQNNGPGEIPRTSIQAPSAA